MQYYFRNLLTALLLGILSTGASAQGIHQLWGMTTTYGPLGKGAIFRTNFNGQVISAEHPFDDARPGTNGCNELTEYNGEFFATAFVGGFGNVPQALMKWNPSTNIYTVLHRFEETEAIPNGRIYVFDNKIYGVTSDGGTADAGVIYEYDLATNVFTIKKNLSELLAISTVQGAGFCFYNNKFYGVAKNAFDTDNAVFFEWEPLTNTFTKTLAVSGSGSPSPYAAMTMYDNKLYGAASPTSGGNGSIFEWDLSTNKYTTKKSFAGGVQGYLPFSELVLKDNKFYSILAKGGANNSGVIFEWDPATNVYTKKIDLPVGTNDAFNAAPLTLFNGKFYATGVGGPNGKGYIYEWDNVTNTFTIRFDFAGQSGTSPQTRLVMQNGMFYSSTYRGGKFDGGIMFEWEPVSGAFAKKFDFNESNGHGALNSVTLLNGKLYGMTSLGGSEDMGVLFEYDPALRVYKRMQDLDATKGGNPEGNLTERNGKLYGMTKTGGANNAGTLFEWDVANNVFNKKFNLGGLDGAKPSGSLTLKDGKLYGMTTFGGTNDQGVIFEWEPDANIFTKRKDLSASDGGHPYGHLSLKDDKFYGMTSEGGTALAGVLFEWEPSSGNYVIKQNFDASKGTKPYGGLALDNGLFYGVTSAGGAQDLGVVFQWDPLTNTFPLKKDIPANYLGYAAKSTPVVSYGRVYYVTTMGGAAFAGSIAEWRPDLGTLQGATDFTIDTGQDPIYTSLVKVPAGISPGTAGFCQSLPFVGASSGNSQTWLPITDMGGNAVAEIMPNGNNLGGIFPSVYVHNGPVRRDKSDQFYLNRNLTINANNPNAASGTQFDVRFYIKQEEFDALMAANNAEPGNTPITGINDVGVFKSTANACNANFTAPAYPVASSVEPYTGGYVFTFSVTSFSSFYIAAKNITVLPVKLVDFKVRREENSAVLSWKTGEETHFSHFEIQRSVNGKNFSPIGTVKGGTGGSGGEYTFTDPGLQTVRGTHAYYRLKMIDTDESFAYSTIVELPLNGAAAAVYPNPAGKSVQVNLGWKTPTTWQIIDKNGNQVTSGKAGSGTFEVDVRQLRSGYYILKATSNSLNASYKLLKE